LFTFILLIATSAILLPYAASSAARLRSGGKNGGRVVASLALVYSVYALTGAGAEALAWGAVLLLAGVPVYLWMRHSNRTLPAQARDSAG
jgi:APA family basic amino acid/polyamine antiporter